MCKVALGVLVLVLLVTSFLLFETYRGKALQHAEDQASLREMAELHARFLAANNVPFEKYVSEIRGLQLRHKYWRLLNGYLESIERVHVEADGPGGAADESSTGKRGVRKQRGAR